MKLIRALSTALLLLGAAMYVNQTEAGPIGCNCTTFSRYVNADRVGGRPTCHGCPHNASCRNRAPSERGVLIGGSGDPNACILGGAQARGTAHPYKSVREACQQDNMYLYEWDPTGGALVPNCHFAGRRSGDYDYGLPWCSSRVDTAGDYIGVTSFTPSMIVVTYSGAPGWRNRDTAEFVGRAIDIYGEDCWNGPSVLSNSGGTMMRAYTNDELSGIGFRTAGASVNAGVCYNPSRGGFVPVARHSCKIYTLMD